MPNSIIQGLTTATPTNLNRLTTSQMVTLFGLLAHVSSTDPRREVQIRFSDILEIVRVGQCAGHAVDRIWTNRDGALRRKQYHGRRYSPKHRQQVHDALVALYDQSVVIRQRTRNGSGERVLERTVHLLDSFGYVYRIDGRPVDVDDLPPEQVKVNVGSAERPVWRIRRRSSEGERFERPAGILFRLNTELADELANRIGSLGFTIFADRVFSLFRSLMKSPAAMRLLILVLRQTGGEFKRVLGTLLDDLGWDAGHRTRSIRELERVLGRMRDEEIIAGFVVDPEADRVHVQTSRDWHRRRDPDF